MGAMGVTPESHRAHGALLPRAARADAVHFQRLRLRPEAQRLRARFKLRDHVEVLEFGRTVAAIADQERHRVLRRARVVAGNERVDRLELVDEAVGEQEIERAVDGRRRGGTCALRSEEHTSELQSLMSTSYAVFCLKKTQSHTYNTQH